jgi:hypothetical protein
VAGYGVFGIEGGGVGEGEPLREEEGGEGQGAGWRGGMLAEGLDIAGCGVTSLVEPYLR